MSEQTPEPLPHAEPISEPATAEGETSTVGRASSSARELPQTPGVCLMKASAGRVIYVGKAKNLRARVCSYFLKAAAEDRRTADLVREIADLDFITAES